MALRLSAVSRRIAVFGNHWPVSFQRPSLAPLLGVALPFLPAALTTTTTTSWTAGFSSDALEKNKSLGTAASDSPPLTEFRRRKQKAKQWRTERYFRKLEKRQNRRSADTGKKKAEFRSWFDPFQVHHRYLMREARQLQRPWKVRVATVVERIPQILPDEPPWQAEFLELQAYLQSFGKVFPRELHLATGRHDDDDDEEWLDDEEKEARAKQRLGHTPQGARTADKEYLLDSLPEDLALSPRETEADRTGNVRSMDRKLQDRLYLTILGTEEGAMWKFPSVYAEETETLLDAAKRATAETVGSSLHLYCPSNCPMAVNLHKYPPSSDSEYYGEQIFYYLVQYDYGDVDLESSSETVQDYAWWNRDEIVAKITEERGPRPSRFYRYLL